MLPPPEGGASPAPTRLARVVLEMRAGNKKGRHPTGSAPTNRILWNTLYFPFFGPLASSFFPFFFMAMLLPPRPHAPQSIAHLGHDGRCPTMPSRYVCERRARLSRKFRVTA